MSDLRVASRYAKSLLVLANEQGVLEEVNNDMKMFDTVLKQNRDLVLLLRNPIVNHAKKLQVLEAIFKSKVNKLTMAFFTIITKKNRESVLPVIATNFATQYNIFKNIEEAKVITTFPLDAALRKEFAEIVKKFTGKEVILTEEVNKDLLGGFVLKIGDRQIDESISSRLKALKLKFSQNPYVKTF